MTCSSFRYVGRPPTKILFAESGTFVDTTPGTCMLGAIISGPP